MIIIKKKRQFMDDLTNKRQQKVLINVFVIMIDEEWMDL